MEKYKVGSALLILHRICFYLFFLVGVLIVYEVNVTEVEEFETFLKSSYAQALFSYFALAGMYNFYVIVFGIYDAVSRKRKNAFLWVLSFFLFPLVITYIYFEIFVFKGHFFVKSNAKSNALTKT